MKNGRQDRIAETLTLFVNSRTKIILKLPKYIYSDYQTHSCKSSSEGTKETELLDFQ